MKSFRKNRKTRKTRRRKQFKGGAAMIKCTNCGFVYGRDKCSKGWFGGLSCICPRCQSTKYTEFEQDLSPAGAFRSGPTAYALTQQQTTPSANALPMATWIPPSAVSALPVADATPRY
jgi:hypothetical protein